MALEQKLKDENGTDLIFMGDIDKFREDNLPSCTLDSMVFTKDTNALGHP